MNHIWESIIHLKRKNPRHSSRNPFIHDKAQCLIILDENQEYAKLKTNDMVVSRHIEQQCGKKFSIENIEKIEPLSNYGRSHATF